MLPLSFHSYAILYCYFSQWMITKRWCRTFNQDTAHSLMESTVIGCQIKLIFYQATYDQVVAKDDETYERHNFLGKSSKITMSGKFPCTVIIDVFYHNSQAWVKLCTQFDYITFSLSLADFATFLDNLRKMLT